MRSILFPLVFVCASLLATLAAEPNPACTAPNELLIPGETTIFAPIACAGLSTEANWEVYADAVTTYVPGSFDLRRDRLGTIDDVQRREIESAVANLAQLFERRRRQGGDHPSETERVLLNGRSYQLSAVGKRLALHRDRLTDIRPFLRRAALLHADALAAYGGGGMSSALQLHERLGSDAAHLLVKTCGETNFAGDWFFATAGALTTTVPWAALALLNDARELLPNDSRLRLARGAVHEMLASPRVADAVAASDGGPVPSARPYRSVPVSSPNRQLKDAVESFREAAALDPHVAETHLRLGRVLALLSQWEPARTELRRAETVAPADLFIRYHVAMFLGDLEERVLDVGRAEAHYRRALAVAPAAQTPRIALSHLFQISNRHSEALEVLFGYLSEPRQPLVEREEPWLSYSLGAGRFTDTVLVKLRDEVDR